MPELLHVIQNGMPLAAVFLVLPGVIRAALEVAVALVAIVGRPTRARRAMRVLALLRSRGMEGRSE